MNLKDTYNKIAEDWNRDHHDDTWWHEGTKKFISFLDHGDQVLDVGCGAGHKTKYLVEHGLKAIGTDLSEKMLGIAKREVPEVNFIVQDMRDTNQLKRQFDGIFAQACLLHIPKKEAQIVIEAILTKLKSGGYFYIAVKELKSGSKEEEILEENDYGYKYERFFSYYTLDEVKNYFTKLKMKIVFEDVTNSGHTNWVQVIAKKESK